MSRKNFTHALEYRRISSARSNGVRLYHKIGPWELRRKYISQERADQACQQFTKRSKEHIFRSPLGDVIMAPAFEYRVVEL